MAAVDRRVSALVTSADSAMDRPDAGRVVRVAFALDSMAIGGTEMNMLKLASRLDRSRFPLVVYYNRGGPLLPKFEALGVPLRQVGLRSLKSPSALSAVGRVRRWLREDKIDVLHSHDVYSNILGALAVTPANGARLIVSRRWGARHYGLALRAGNRLAYRRAHLVLANSQGVARSLHDEEGVPARRIVVVHNFAEATAFRSDTPGERAELRARLGVPQEALVVGCIANLRPVKNQAMIVRALAEIPRSGSAVHLVLIGEGPSRSMLQGLASGLGLADRVHLVGQIPEAAHYHRAFDVSVLASLSEGFPNTLVEAMAAARAVVATNVGGIPDAIADNETGFLIAPNDLAAFANALERLLGDPVLRFRMGAAGREFAAVHFHEGAVMPRLERVYAYLRDAMP